MKGIMREQEIKLYENVHIRKIRFNDVSIGTDFFFMQSLALQLVNYVIRWIWIDEDGN